MMKIEELADTASLMSSEDYKDRFKAEYYQTKIRYEKLKAFNNKIEASQFMGAKGPVHDCPEHFLRQQQSAMGNYLHYLEVRAVIEEIEL